MTSIWTN